MGIMFVPFIEYEFKFGVDGDFFFTGKFTSLILIENKF